MYWHCIQSRFQQVHKKPIKNILVVLLMLVYVDVQVFVSIESSFAISNETSIQLQIEFVSVKNVGIFMSSEVSTESSMKVHRTFIRQQRPDIRGFFSHFFIPIL